MSNKLGLGKAYRIIRNVNCAICGFSTMYTMGDTIRMFNGLASSTYSIFAFPLFVMALFGIYELEKCKKKGIVMLLLGEAFGGMFVGLDPYHPEEAVFTFIVFGVCSLMQLMSINWKMFFKS